MVWRDEGVGVVERYRSGWVIVVVVDIVDVVEVE